ncbi:oxygenase MpaB family protein [Mycobacteroides salmoniphilum]|uniref:ER-bound oxygenase mpaB/mpaB'/Rubber oxygenase catalytic domain-containing protein n=1 Tax=Mycobacteroides salmoniphilum TaxID=404941 RepID=A0A4R8SMZ7_9MYCO|nr:oxygenase MpaB family protein [Mycobacteroides salmoniphilum]TEA00369.1 hypothetical protein CCUG60884_04259 [Mycobacteroides salmoniphilum]
MSVANIPHDPARTLRITQAYSRFPDELVNVFVEGMFQTDSLVDAVADELSGSGGAGWQAANDALTHARPTVDDAPPSLEALLTPVMSTPPWFDPEQVRWGAALWWRFWISNQIGLAGSLRTGYRFGDLNKPQAMNGRSTVMAAKRYEETARWVLDATEPGGLVPGRPGFSSTVKIRLVHAMVRRRLRRDPQWNTAAWGEPIHTSGMALTGIAFLILPLAAVEMVGIEYTDDEKEAIRALWHWVCYLMGVAEPLLPHTIDHARSIADIATAVFAPPDEDTRILDNAVMHNGIRAERALPSFLRPALAPVLRPIFSYGIWGVSNAIVAQLEEHADDPQRVNHPVVRALRPLVARREKSRLNGQLGSDFEIAARQRKGITTALGLIDAAPQALQPHEAMAATR